MATTYLLGRGSSFQINTGSAWQTIDQVATITLGESTREKFEITHLQSNGTEWALGMTEVADVQAELIFAPKTSPLHNFIVQELNAPSASYYGFRFNLPNAGATSASFYEWTGSFMSQGLQAVTPKKEDRLQFKIAVSGQMTFTPNA